MQGRLRLLHQPECTCRECLRLLHQSECRCRECLRLLHQPECRRRDCLRLLLPVEPSTIVASICLGSEQRRGWLLRAAQPRPNLSVRVPTAASAPRSAAQEGRLLNLSAEKQVYDLETKSKNVLGFEAKSKEVYDLETKSEKSLDVETQVSYLEA